MKSRSWIPIIAVILQLVFALFPLIPGLKSLLPAAPTQREQLEWQIQIIGFGFAIVTAMLGILLVLQEKGQREAAVELKLRFPTKVIKLRDDEFYPDFLLAAKKATSTVNIMYLSLMPPDYTQHQDRLDYYRDMLNLIRRKQNVKFNRIVRQSPQTKEWISSLIRDLRGSANASIVIIRESETENMPLSLSTQIIDSSKVWFVAIQAHERQGAFRDIYIEDQQVAEAMVFYYDRLWIRGKLLLEAGQITDDGQKFLESLR